ncbi:activator-dependent family glycosyltransferase [Amycolatopsis marina]|nr:activator-dependent family glycosyltransferase [Amycolatopsis marina]
MRVLFVSSMNKSHVYLMAPLAWAMRTAGHDVRFASQPDLAADVASIGFLPVPIGPSMDSLAEQMAEAEPQEDPFAPATAPGVGAKPRQGEYSGVDPVGLMDHLVSEFYQMLTPDSAIDDLVDYARQWRPDLVIWHTLAFAGPVAAKVSGAAHARMPWGVDTHAQVRSEWRRLRTERGNEAVADPLEQWLGPILERHGEEFDESVALGQWTVDPAPSWVFHPAGAGLHYVPFRQVPFHGPATVPSWVEEPRTRRRVCVTLGFSHREAQRPEAASDNLLEAVADLDVEVVATLDAKQLGSLSRLPDNVRAVEFVPLTALLPSCSAVVHHGGPGTFATAVEHGVPQLIVPGTYWHIKWWGPIGQANGLEDRGAGVYVADADQLTPALLRDQLVRVLDDPSFGRNAARLRTEAIGTPSINEVVPMLEKLTREHRG